jgi:hypothetical protein
MSPVGIRIEMIDPCPGRMQNYECDQYANYIQSNAGFDLEVRKVMHFLGN